jgi:hypothetical protein
VHALSLNAKHRTQLSIHSIVQISSAPAACALQQCIADIDGVENGNLYPRSRVGSTLLKDSRVYELKVCPVAATSLQQATADALHRWLVCLILEQELQHGVPLLTFSCNNALELHRSSASSRRLRTICSCRLCCLVLCARAVADIFVATQAWMAARHGRLALAR